MSVKPFVHVRLHNLPHDADPAAEAGCHPTIGSLGAHHCGSLVAVQGTVIRSAGVKMLLSQQVYECTRCQYRCAIPPCAPAFVNPSHAMQCTLDGLLATRGTCAPGTVAIPSSPAVLVPPLQSRMRSAAMVPMQVCGASECGGVGGAAAGGLPQPRPSCLLPHQVLPAPRVQRVHQLPGAAGAGALCAAALSLSCCTGCTAVQALMPSGRLPLQEKMKCLAMGTLPASITVVLKHDLADTCQPGGVPGLAASPPAASCSNMLVGWVGEQQDPPSKGFAQGRLHVPPPACARLLVPGCLCPPACARLLMPACLWYGSRSFGVPTVWLLARR
jgi:hypothetical protein